MHPAMRGHNSTIGAKSGRSRISQSSPRAVPPSVNICHSRRGYSLASARTSSWPSSKFMNSNIYDLPDSLLVEIFCRLPSYKSVSQCKCVSKRWCTLISDTHFMGRFLYLQRDRNQKPITTAINTKGEEFLRRMSPSSQPLNQLFPRLVSFHGLKQEPVVVGTYNDLVLCCASEFNQRDYYICNPYTIQWVPLPPPPPQVCKFVLVGFICDIPYYNNKEDYEPGDMIQLNADYRCRVVRLMDPDDADDEDKEIVDFSNFKLIDMRDFCTFKVQIFSSETSEWKETTVRSERTVTSAYNFTLEMMSVCTGVASKRMLYWMGDDDVILIQLDPFMIDKSASATLSTCYRHRIRNEWDALPMRCIAAYDGGVRMCNYDYVSGNLSICELKEEEEDDDPRVSIHGGSKSLFVKLKKRVYLVDETKVVIGPWTEIEGVFFDQNNEDTLYMIVDTKKLHGRIKDIFRCNIVTGEVSKIVGNRKFNCFRFFPIVIPWWPTPVPRLAQGAISK